MSVILKQLDQIVLEASVNYSDHAILSPRAKEFLSDVSHSVKVAGGEALNNARDFINSPTTREFLNNALDFINRSTDDVLNKIEDATGSSIFSDVVRTTGNLVEKLGGRIIRLPGDIVNVYNMADEYIRGAPNIPEITEELEQITKELEQSRILIFYNNILNKAPERMRDSIDQFLRFFGNNRIVRWVFENSNDNPAVFIGTLVLMPVALLSVATGVGIYAARLANARSLSNEVEIVNTQAKNAARSGNRTLTRQKNKDAVILNAAVLAKSKLTK